jgi:REP element-mobilizing transposase RayT
MLANDTAHTILKSCWMKSLELHGWAVGEYVIRPDHVHFFIREATETTKSLTDVVQRWKQFSARGVNKSLVRKSSQFWQPGFFDRLLRSEKEWEEKRHYMLQNPVRAGLVNHQNEWPYKGDLDMFRI